MSTHDRAAVLPEYFEELEKMQDTDKTETAELLKLYWDEFEKLRDTEFGERGTIFYSLMI